MVHSAVYKLHDVHLSNVEQALHHHVTYHFIKINERVKGHQVINIKNRKRLWMIFDLLGSVISAAHVYVLLFILMWENNICYVFKQVISEVCQRCAITVNAITVQC